MPYYYYSLLEGDEYFPEFFQFLRGFDDGVDIICDTEDYMRANESLAEEFGFKSQRLTETLLAVYRFKPIVQNGVRT